MQVESELAAGPLTQVASWADLTLAVERETETLTRSECSVDELEAVLGRIAGVLRNPPPVAPAQLASEPIGLYRNALQRLETAIAVAQERLLRRRAELAMEREELARLKAWNAGARHNF